MRYVAVVLAFLLGIALGGWLFSDTQPRSFLAVGRCTNCWTLEDLAGLVGSVVMQRMPRALPAIEIETDRSVAIRSPLAEGRTHYVIIPKRDIRNVGELATGDEAYLIDAYAVIGRLIWDKGLRNYRVFTRGPGGQSVTLLHFHLISNDTPTRAGSRSGG
ncbi:MAG: HIT domain-containing protein [Candidatus Eiseniibacteriota bacterium]